MNAPAYLLAAVLASGAAHGACKDHSRDLEFVELAVPDGAPRPADASAFAFIDADTTLPALIAKVGPPDASTGSHPARFVWCLPDGSEVYVASEDGATILNVRHGGKLLFKREKKKPRS